MTIAFAMVIAACGTSQEVDRNTSGADVTEMSEAASTEAEMGEDVDTSADSKYIIKGADISSLQAVEDYGGKFYDFDGNEVDAIEFFLESGCNYFRLRIWNNPTESFDAGDYCDLEHTKVMAKRIKEAGGQYLLDFHYSDWWADPNSQSVPEAWKDLSDEELVQAVYDYTSEVLNALAEEDAYPDMVQIGNEIGNGMLWDYGSSDNPDGLAALLNSGISAVRDTTPDGEDTQIMIHVEYGGYSEPSQTFFQTIEAHGVTDYDIIGLSYYPYWHGTFAEVKQNIQNLYEKFGKQVVLAETAYPFTTENADDKRNLITEADTKLVGFEATPENQKLVLELLFNTVATTEGGLGAFYWEPTWLAVDGAGVSKGSGNEWENQALFDFDGNALPAIEAYSYELGSVDNDQALFVYPIENLEIDKNATDDMLLDELPEYADVLYMDGSIRQTPITWDISSKKVITDTHVAFKGKVLDFDISAGADLR
jgi:arabinogalactan endo-1,4-beta-galactosidase